MDNFFSFIGGCFLFLVLVFAFFVATWSFISKRPAENYKDKIINYDNKPKLNYTILNIDRRVSSKPWESTVYCKDGVVYLPTKDNMFGRKIGSFSHKGEDSFMVYDEQGYCIGSFYGGDDIQIWFDHSGTIERNPYVRSKIFNSAKGFSWHVAEVIERIGAIIDEDDYKPIAHFDGKGFEAAAAFVCWAFWSHENKYNDFFDVW